jgi:chorismate synthase
MMLRFLTAGESHGPALTAILEGIPAGLELSPELINRELMRRQKGYGAGGRMKIEKDAVRILGGLMGGLTTGAPLAFLVENADHIKWKGKAVEAMTAPRPGHADLTGAVKYGYHDLRPALERASARETSMRVAAGAVCKHFLAQFGIRVGGYVQAIGDISADLTGMPYPERFKQAEESAVRCPDTGAAEKMHIRIEKIMHSKDTLGGVLEVIALGVPVGLGSFTQWDRRLDAQLGAAVLSVQAIKGIEIGEAWENARRTGIQAQDAIGLDGQTLSRSTNRAGGIERSDFCPVPRAVPILEAMVAFVLAEALIEKLGGDSMEEMLPRFSSLRKARLEDLLMDSSRKVWWE